MEEEVKQIKPIHCSECKSSQIRTTKKERICNRCGFREKLE